MFGFHVIDRFNIKAEEEKKKKKEKWKKGCKEKRRFLVLPSLHLLVQSEL